MSWVRVPPGTRKKWRPFGLHFFSCARWDSTPFFYFANAKALHFIPLGGPPGPLSLAYSLRPNDTVVSFPCVTSVFLLQTFTAVFAVVGVEVGLLVAAGASAILAFFLGGINHGGRYNTGWHSYDGVTQDHDYS